MRIAKLRLLDKLQVVALDCPVYVSGYKVLEQAISADLVEKTGSESRPRVRLTARGAEMVREMGV